MAKVIIKGVPKMRNTTVQEYNPHWSNSTTKDEFDEISPSIDKINSTVGPVDEEVATIEAEKGEKIVKPGLTGIWEIKGKKHSQGGTPLNPEPGSFIFSDDPKLAITKDEKKLFGFKQSGTVAKRKNTPSKILDREIDIKEYNRYISILENPKAERIEKATAKLMVEKYQKTMGQVAFLQENKKNQEAPEFSMGTAPLKNPTIEAKEEEQDMYKMGGKYEEGDPFCPCGKNPDGSCIENCPPGVYDNILASKAKKVDKPLPGYNPLYTSPTGSKLFGKFGSINIKSGEPSKGSPEFNNAFRKAKQQGLKAFTFNGKLYNTNVFNPKSTSQDIEDYIYVDPAVEQPGDGGGEAPVPPTPPTPLKQPEMDNTPSLPYDIKGYLTPAQKAHLSYLGLQAMSVKKYMPMRQQIDLPQARLDKVNLQPFLNNINNQQFQAYNSANVINPRQASLLNSNTLGRGMDATVQATGQVENQNVQIGNQENLTNLQQSNQEQMFNIPASGRYYDQTVMANQNFDDEKRFAKNQVMSTLNKYQSDADQLAWMLAAQNKYGNRKVTDPKTGKTYNLPTPLYSYNPKGGITYNADVASLSMATGADRQNSMSEYYSSIQKLMELGLDQKSASYIIGNIIKSKQPIYSSNPTFPQ